MKSISSLQFSLNSRGPKYDKKSEFGGLNQSSQGALPKDLH